MTTKLTLSVRAKTVDMAKKYARKKGTSVSKLFEDHITALTDRDKKEKTDPLESLRKLKGIAKDAISKNTNYKDVIADIIIEKHMK